MRSGEMFTIIEAVFPKLSGVCRKRKYLLFTEISVNYTQLLAFQQKIITTIPFRTSLMKTSLVDWCICVVELL